MSLAGLILFAISGVLFVLSFKMMGYFLYKRNLMTQFELISGIRFNWIKDIYDYYQLTKKENSVGIWFKLHLLSWLLMITGIVMFCIG